MSVIVLQKALARAGAASRRASEQLIKAGRVTVNGERISRPGIKVDEAVDAIKLDGKLLKRPEPVYFLLHKPAGYIATVDDERGRRTAASLVKTKERIFPVGRLDINTTGLLLLTNDGDLAYKLTHPKFAVEKEYQALARAPKNWSPGFLQKNLDKLKDGVTIAGGFKTSAAVGKVIKKTGSGDNSYLLEIIVHEGRKHEVRQMLSGLGLSVIKLHRGRVGNFTLGKLRPGQYRQLSAEEIKRSIS